MNTQTSLNMLEHARERLYMKSSSGNQILVKYKVKLKSTIQ